MEERHALKVRLVDTGEERVAEVVIGYTGSRRKYTFGLTVPGVLSCGCEAGDKFWALIGVRRVIEPLGWRILCNGSRRDVWPSGMCLSMASGRLAYVMKMGKPSGPEYLVNVFDPCDAHLVATIDEQIAFRDRWIAAYVPPVAKE
ncbi:MAG: hypothetical protein AAF495_20830 [Pseudomonadota bacterium]